MKETPSNNLLPRPPIVVVVGHVDHGKTSLLDYIRDTNVITKEAGAITQSTGAYEIEHSPEGVAGDVKRVTFIDTPGHEAFSKMRERGARAADIAILVVAADEGVKQQTLEALNILKTSETPFIVAITKIDKPNADVQKVKNELISNGILLEGFGGDISWQAVSSKTGDGVNELLNLILLMGEVLDLKFNPEAQAKGFVIESLKENRRGVAAYLILIDGILKERDEIKTLSAKGHVKVLENFLGKRVKELTPSSPASVFGFESLPLAGEEFYTGDARISAQAIDSPLVKNELAEAQLEENKTKAVLKADTSGSLEVLSQVISHLVKVTGVSVGDITDGDVKLAASLGSVIIGFGVKVNKAAESVAKAQDVKIFTADVIYKLVEEIETYVKEKSGPIFSGELEILKVFGVEGNRQIVGGKVTFGSIKTGSEISIERGEKASGSGKIINVQENKKDVNEVKENNECGLLIDSETKIKVGDKIKAS